MQGSSLKVGDFIKYNYDSVGSRSIAAGVVVKVNETGGTVRVLGTSGVVGWLVTSYCEKVHNVEGR